MTTILVSDLRPGHTLTGLDNGYVVEVEEQDGYLSVPTGRHNVALPDDTVCVTFHDPDGNEVYLLAPGNMSVSVANEAPSWVG